MSQRLIAHYSLLITSLRFSASLRLCISFLGKRRENPTSLVLVDESAAL